MNILNFISWIKAGKYSSTTPINAVAVVGVLNPTRGDAYLPVTVPISALGTNIGKLMGGGIVINEWFENGIHKALIASLTDLSSGLPWTFAPWTITLLGSTSWSDGLTNTNAIIAQTGAPATTAYAAGIARLYLGGGYTDWYLPAAFELNMCFNSAAVVNKVLGATGFITGSFSYWSSTQIDVSNAFRVSFYDGNGILAAKSSGGSYVRAVRIHTIT